MRAIAYCLMSSHAHLLPEDAEGHLGEVMKPVLIDHAQRFNKLGEIALTGLKARGRVRRNALLFELKDAGLSISQIQRLTGIGRGVIARAYCYEGTVPS